MDVGAMYDAFLLKEADKYARELYGEDEVVCEDDFFDTEDYDIYEDRYEK